MAAEGLKDRYSRSFPSFLIFYAGIVWTGPGWKAVFL